MAFVSEKCMDKWFDPEEKSWVYCWVYKGFQFLFKNPLWNARVPQGFSLCPYYWMSVFSWLIFRPFVYMVGIPLASLMKLLFFVFGKPLVKLDSWVGQRMFCSPPFPGVSLSLALVAIVGATFFVLGGIVVIIGMMYAWWLTEPLFLKWLFPFLIINLIGVIIAAGYTAHHQYEEDKCKPLYHMLAIFVVTSAGMYIVSPDSMTQALTTSSSAMIAGTIGLFKMAGLCCVFVAEKIWWGLSHIWGAISFDVMGMAIILWAVVFGLISMAVLKATEMLCNNIQSIENVQKSKRCVSKKEWDELILSLIYSEKFGLANMFSLQRLFRFYLEQDPETNDYMGRLSLYEGDSVSSTVLWKKIARIIENQKLPKALEEIKYVDFKKIKKELLGDCTPVCISSVWEYLSVIKSELQNINGIDEIDKREIKKMVETINKKEENEKSRKKSCEQTTRALESFFLWVFCPFIKIFQAVVFMLKIIGTFFIYLWIATKSIKSKACPYRQFKPQPKGEYNEKNK